MPTSKADLSSLSTRELLEEFAAELARRGGAEVPEEDMSTMELALEAQAEALKSASLARRLDEARAGGGHHTARQATPVLASTVLGLMEAMAAPRAPHIEMPEAQAGDGHQGAAGEARGDGCHRGPALVG